MQPQNSSDSILVLWYVTEKCDFLIRVSFKRRSAGSSMVASVLSMAKTISRPIPSRLWNQFKFLFNCTHFCPIIRRVPKKNITVVPSHPSSRTPPRYKGQVLLSWGNVLIWGWRAFSSIFSIVATSTVTLDGSSVFTKEQMFQRLSKWAFTVSGLYIFSA